MRRLLPWTAWALAACGALWLGFGGSELGTAPGVAEVRTVALSGLRTARVLAVGVKRGERVAAGQVVVRLDASEVDAELAIARAELDRLVSQGGTGAGDRALANDRRGTSARLAAAAERASSEVVQLEVAGKRDRAELAELERQIARQQELSTQQIASADVLERLHLRRAVLVQQVESSAAMLREARQRRDAAVERFGGWLGVAVNVQQERCRELELQRDGFDLRAPFAGRVGAVLLQPGETARAGAPVVTVVDEHPAMAVAYVDQAWAQRVAVGDRVTLAPADRIGPARRGLVTALAPSISPTPPRFPPPFGQTATYSREAYITLEPQEPPPLPGQAFQASFSASRPRSTGGEPDQGAGP